MRHCLMGLLMALRLFTQNTQQAQAVCANGGLQAEFIAHKVEPA